MKTKKNFSMRDYLAQGKSSRNTDRPVLVLFPSGEVLSELHQAVADAAAYTGHPYTSILDQLKIIPS